MEELFNIMDEQIKKLQEELKIVKKERDNLQAIYVKYNLELMKSLIDTHGYDIVVEHMTELITG